MTTKSPIQLLLAVICAGGMVVACGGEGDTATSPSESSINTVEASATPTDVMVEEIVTVSCLRRSPAGVVLAGTDSRWDVYTSVGASSLAPVNPIDRGPTRQFRGVAKGKATVACAYRNADGTLPSIAWIDIQVLDYSITVDPRPDPLAAGESQQVAATVSHPREGSVLLSNNNISWASASPTVLRADPGDTPARAVFTALSSAPPSTANVTVTFRAPSGRLVQQDIPVLLVYEGTMSCQPTTIPIGATSTCTLRTSSGETVANDVVSVTWTSATPSIARVSSDGVVTGVSGGTVTIRARRRSLDGSTATNANIRGSANITVTSAALVVACSPSSVRADSTSRCTASTSAAGLMAAARQVGDAGVAAPAAPPAHDVLTSGVTWTSSNTTIAAVDADGNVRAAGSNAVSGTVTISASAVVGGQTLTGNTSVTIRAAPVADIASVGISTNDPVSGALVPATIQVGRTLDVFLSPRDAAGNPLFSFGTSFTSSDPSKATVNVSGRVTGVAAGTAVITGTAQSGASSKSATVTVTVTP